MSDQETEAVAEDAVAEDAAASEAQAPTLGLNDLALMANVIQVTADRGAIKANEMGAVGALYTKIVSFVNANVPPQPVAEETDSIVETDVENTSDETPEEE